MSRRSLLQALSLCVVLLSSSLSSAALRRVPAQYPTIQAAIDAAKDGDKIRVSRGEHCGAIVTKRVTLEGRGQPRIVGCAGSPTVAPGARVGFFLPGAQGANPASGTRISGFVFDGFSPGSRNTTAAFNDGRKSEKAIVVEGSGGTNTEGLLLLRNRGKVEREGTLVQLFALGKAAAPALAQPLL